MSNQILEKIKADIAVCQQCPLHKEAIRPTPSSGLSSLIMFIGRNPGEQERDAGLPFVGKTKQTMDGMLQALGYTRDDCYITNLVKCFTCIPKTNRAPTIQEINACTNTFLKQEIETIKPQVLITLGKEAFVWASNNLHETCTGHTGIPHRFTWLPDITVFPLFHPAMTLYDPVKYGQKMNANFMELFNLLKQKNLLGPLHVF